MRTFESGATRNTDVGKPDFARCMAPSVVKAYGDYMARHAVQADGAVREPDNWKKGMPLQSYVSSGARHFVELWGLHELGGTREEKIEACCALLFNIQGYLYETLKEGATIEVVVDRDGRVAQPELVKPSLDPDDWKAVVDVATRAPFPGSEATVTFARGDRVADAVTDRRGVVSFDQYEGKMGLEGSICVDWFEGARLEHQCGVSISRLRRA